MKKFIIIVLLSITAVMKAQPGKEAWHWEFGATAAIDFTNGLPVPVVLFSYGSLEGCASYSDPTTGQRILYTNGVAVMNKNGNLMFNGNGLKGNTNTTQSALIIPKQGNANQFYIISADYGHSANHGVYYSLVDVLQHNGQGEVIQKNLRLTPPPTTEKLVGARHCNGRDYWILTHGANSNKFFAYKVDASGIDTTPVVSQTGTVHQMKSTYWAEAIGYMKVSPDGRKLALGICSDSIPLLEIFDFDNISGTVNNPITITYPGALGPYGLTFSPDNTKLYACAFPGDTMNCVYQYDLSSGIPATIIASQTIVHLSKIANTQNGKGDFGAMQLAPDGKIYIARNEIDTLAVIQSPNSLGLACNLQLSAFPLYQGGATTSYFGLPNFIDANYAGIQINIPDVQQCNTFTVTTLDAGPGFANYFWSTGAGTQAISINSPGKYWVTVTNAQGCTRTDTVNAYLLNPMKLDTVACDTFHANVMQGGVLAYNWYDANHNPMRDFTQSGNYYVDINYVSGCAIRDSLNVTVVPSPQINIGQDTTFCKGNLLLDASCNTCNYQWNTGESLPVIRAKTAGTYWIKVTDANGCTDLDTLIVKPQLIAFDFQMPNIVTPNGDNINDEIDFGKYQFSSMQINIYNRWGQKVFSSEDPEVVWRPTGDEGTYFYTGQYRIDCGADTQWKVVKGFITVAR